MNLGEIVSKDRAGSLVSNKRIKDLENDCEQVEEGKEEPIPASFLVAYF